MLSVSAELERKPNRFELVPCAIQAVVCLPDDEYEYFENTLLAHHEFLLEYKDLMGSTTTGCNCILVLGENSDHAILCDSEGYSYARYAAPMPGAKEYLNSRMEDVANRVLLEAAQKCKDSMAFLDYDDFLEKEGFDLRKSTYLLELLEAKMKENFGVYSVDIGIEEIRINMDPELCLERCRIITGADYTEKDRAQPEQEGRSAKSLLKAKLDAVYTAYRAKWLKMTPENLINNCEEIEAVTRMYKDAPEMLSEEDAEYLLRFKDPLAVLSNEWSSRNGIGSLIIDEEVRNIMWELVDKQAAEESFEMEPGYNDPTGSPKMAM